MSGFAFAFAFAYVGVWTIERQFKDPKVGGCRHRLFAFYWSRNVLFATARSSELLQRTPAKRRSVELKAWCGVVRC